MYGKICLFDGTPCIILNNINVTKLFPISGTLQGDTAINGNLYVTNNTGNKSTFAVDTNLNLLNAYGKLGINCDLTLKQVWEKYESFRSKCTKSPEIVEKIRFALPDEMFDESNKGLINWFHILLYQVPAQEFLEIIGNAISEDQSKISRATSRFEEIMKEAMQMKEEFENYKEENDTESDSDDDDEDDLDDFLGSLGISRPK